MSSAAPFHFDPDLRDGGHAELSESNALVSLWGTGSAKCSPSLRRPLTHSGKCSITFKVEGNRNSVSFGLMAPSTPTDKRPGDNADHKLYASVGYGWEGRLLRCGKYCAKSCGAGPHREGDEIRIDVDMNGVEFYKNDKLVYTLTREDVDGDEPWNPAAPAFPDGWHFAAGGDGDDRSGGKVRIIAGSVGDAVADALLAPAPVPPPALPIAASESPISAKPLQTPWEMLLVLSQQRTEVPVLGMPCVNSNSAPSTCTVRDLTRARASSL